MLVGRRFGRFIGAVVNVAVAFPGLLLALFFAIIFGVGAKGAVLAIGFAGAPGVRPARRRRWSRASCERDFIAAARIAGVGRFRLLVRHILPNIAEPLIVNATIGAGGALLAFAGLSFLGLGVQPPSYDWGRLLGDGTRTASTSTRPLRSHPGIAVVIAGLAFNLFGEAAAKGIGVTPRSRSDATARGAHRARRRPADRRRTSADSDAVLDVRDLVGDASPARRADPPGARRQLHACAAARRSASSANPARASR